MQHSVGNESVWSNAAQPSQKRPVFKSILRGAFFRCPKCGRRTLFASYLKTARSCPACREELFHHRADDAPPYFTIFIAGHIVLPLLIVVELAYGPPLWLHFAIWLPLIILLSLALLPAVKGGIVGLQWALRMHGFDGASGPDHALRPSNPG